MQSANSLKPVVLFIKPQTKEQYRTLSVVIDKVIEKYYPQYFCLETDAAIHTDTDFKNIYESMSDTLNGKTLFLLVGVVQFGIADFGYRVGITNKDSDDPNVEPMYVEYKSDAESLAKIALVCIENAIEKTNPAIVKDDDLFNSVQNFTLEE